MQYYKAPWDKGLIGWTILLSVGALGVAVWYGMMMEDGHLGDLRYWKGFVPLAYVLGCALFTVRGYVIDGKRVKIRRLLWWTSLPVGELRAVENRPGALQRAAYALGNGGYFAYCGWYRSKDLGALRVWATDRQRTVVLRFAKQTVVLSPERAEEFVEALEGKLGREALVVAA